MEDSLDLPPGFRFHPTDEEIITFYLIEKFRSQNFNPIAIGEANLNSCEPWDLPSQAKMGEKEWYFFCKRFKRYPTGSRTNRATKSGYWKATGKDKEIFHKGKPSSLAGMKKTLVFYLGRAPRGKKTNWVMHEYRLEERFSGNHPPNNSNDEWVVCRVFDKSTNQKTKASLEQERIDSFGDFVSSEDDRFKYDDDRGFAKASPAAMINPFYQTSNIATEYPKFPQRSYFNSNNGQLWSGFPSQEFISSLDNADYMQDFGNFGLPFEGRGNAIMNQAKAEQHSNHSFLSASQDTGQSTDVNTEISSVVSKSDVGVSGSYEDAGYPSFSATPEDGFVSLWQQ